MKEITIVILFLGIIMIIHGIYSEKYKTLEKNKKIEYRFIPRTLYEEQIFDSQFDSKFKNIFGYKCKLF